MRLLKGFALAFNMLTIIPFFKIHDFFKGINAYSAMFYPLVGFFIGSFLWATHTLLNGLVPDVHLAVMISVLWVILTGALHLDGLSDTIDGLFVDKNRAIDVMKDSHVGGMGMVFTLVFLLFKFSSLIHFDAYHLLPIILMFSRLNATLAIYFYPYISSGVGKLLKEELSLRHLLFASLYVLAIAYYFNSLTFVLVSTVSLLLIAYFFTKRLGGLTGDIYGFIIEVTELILLNYIILIHYS